MDPHPHVAHSLKQPKFILSPNRTLYSDLRRIAHANEIVLYRLDVDVFLS